LDVNEVYAKLSQKTANKELDTLNRYVVNPQDQKSYRDFSRWPRERLSDENEGGKEFYAVEGLSSQNASCVCI